MARGTVEILVNQTFVIRNVPLEQFISTYDRNVKDTYIVYRDVDGDFWYYGTYVGIQKAVEVCRMLGEDAHYIHVENVESY